MREICRNDAEIARKTDIVKCRINERHAMHAIARQDVTHGGH